MDRPVPLVLVSWGSRPPSPLVCVYMPGSLQFTAPSLPAAAAQGLSPTPGEPSVDPRWAPTGLSSPGRGHGGGVTGGLFLLVASPRAILQVGLYACCSFLTLIPARGGFGMGSGCGRGNTSSSPWSVLVLGWMGLPHPTSCPILGVSLCQIPPWASQPGLILAGGCGDTGSVLPCGVLGLSLAPAPLLLGLRGCSNPPGLSYGTCVAGGRRGSVAACRGRGCSVPGRTSPRHLILFLLFW